MREVRFRLSASKNFMKEKKMCLTHEFLDPFVSRVASECFFFFPLFLSLLLSLVVVDLDDDDRCRSNNAKDLRIGWSPARSSSRYRLCESAIFKEEEQEREREKKVVSRVVSSSKKRNLFSFSPENVRFFRRVERSRERKRCLFL